MFNKIKCPNEFCQYKINSNIVEDLCDNITFLKYKKFEKELILYQMKNIYLVLIQIVMDMVKKLI